ncbi:MAG: hypothetical protein ACK5GU_11965 [Chloroflexota bacterium]|jgi:hypothetical protein
MNVLLTDLVFPNKYSLWRNLEIASFIEHVSADILVKHIDEFAGVTLNIDYEFCNKHGLLSDYNFLIFNPKYNYLNQYNKLIDGTAFNGASPYSYILTKKSTFDITEYDIVYHIFLNVFQQFNRLYSFPFEKQVIHLYPGGGYNGTELVISPLVHLISSSPITTTHITQLPNNQLHCWLGPFLEKDACIPLRASHLTQPELRICFASLGSGKEKGDQIYVDLAHHYHRTYPTDSVRFVAIGNCAPDPLITLYPSMDYRSLNQFYATNVDIFVNLETGVAFNGWPLGLEAALQGCVLLTTDSRNQRHYYDHADQAILTCSTITEFADSIHALFHNRVFMESTKASFRTFASQYLSYAVQQQRVLDFIHQIHQINQSPVIAHLTNLHAEQAQKNQSLIASQEALHQQIIQLQDQIDKHHIYISHLEGTIHNKNEHIKYLEEIATQHASLVQSVTRPTDDASGRWWQRFISRLNR